MRKETKNQLKLANWLKLLGSRGLHHPLTSKIVAFCLIFLSLVVLDLSLDSPKLLKKQIKAQRQVNLQRKSPRPSPKAKEKAPHWWDETHLSLYEENLIQNIIDREYTKKLAFKANKRARHLNSKGNCLRAVKFSLWEVMKELKNEPKFLDPNLFSCDPGRHPYSYRAGVSAEQFRKWATENPISLYRELHLADVSQIPGIKLEKGFILVYRKSQYGFHNRHGHIEIVTSTNPLMACSDHCRKIRKYRKPSLILAPVTNYAPLYTFEDSSTQILSESSS